jgi:hypothetical protein
MRRNIPVIAAIGGSEMMCPEYELKFATLHVPGAFQREEQL